MPWSIAAPIAGAVVGGLMSDSGGSNRNGGAGTQTASKEPWSAAQPWLRSNLASGQTMQSQYAAAPFNDAQLTAYGNMGAQSDYMRQIIPGLLGTASRQQLGWDRANPDARPERYRFDAAGDTTPGATTQALGGLLGSLSGQSIGNFGAANPLPPAPAPQEERGTFVQQESDPLNQMQLGMMGNYQQFNGPNGTGGSLISNGIVPMGGDVTNFANLQGPNGANMFNGGYGQFKYGMPMPAPGTKAYRDMQEYLAYGGADPYNLYKNNAPGRPFESGPGSGGIGAAGGAGAGSAAGGPGW